MFYFLSFYLILSKLKYLFRVTTKPFSIVMYCFLPKYYWHCYSILKIEGAVVKFQCHNAKYKFVLKAKTNKEGYIYIGSSKNISSYASGHCNVVLESAPNGLKPSNLHGGLTGAHPKSVKRIVSKGVSLIRYTVDPLAFEPKCNH